MPHYIRSDPPGAVTYAPDILIQHFHAAPPESTAETLERLANLQADIGAKFVILTNLLDAITAQGNQAMATYAEFNAALERQTTLIDAVVLYQAEQKVKLEELLSIADNGTEEQFRAGIAAMIANNDKLAATMVTNTPEAGQPLPTPEPLPETPTDPDTGLPVEEPVVAEPAQPEIDPATGLPRDPAA